VEIEEATRRRFFVQSTDNGHGLDHFAVLAQGRLEELQPEAPVGEGQELEVKLVEVGLHDPGSGVGKVDGYAVCVAGAASLVGKKVKVRVERVLDGTAYALRVGREVEKEPLTAEAAAEKPTRQPPRKKAEAEAEPEVEPAEEPEVEPEEEAEGEVAPAAAAETPPKKRTRRGTRGGRKRKKKPTAAEQAQPAADGTGPKIHVPPEDLGAETVEAPAEAVSADGDEPAKAKKKTRRGTRGGRRRRKRPAAATAEAGSEPESPSS
jgi:predicted RNA-binding protein with TRAM domain